MTDLSSRSAPPVRHRARTSVHRCGGWLLRAAALSLITTACSGHETDVSEVTEIRGDVTFTDVAEPVHGATLVVRLENIQAAPSRTVTTQTHTGVSVESGTEAVAYALRARDLDYNGRYQVIAHLDVDGDQKVSAGDFTSSASYPVDPTAAAPQQVNVQLSPVQS